MIFRGGSHRSPIEMLLNTIENTIEIQMNKEFNRNNDIRSQKLI